MNKRINYMKAAPDSVKGLMTVHGYLAQSGLDVNLVNLVYLRVSQINNCAYCLDMHWKDARALGEGEQRLYGLPAWREAPYYSDRERAALELTESVTRIADGGVPDAVIEQAEQHFSRDELSALLFAIVTINAWNRLAISGRSPAGSYQVSVAH